MKSTFGKFQQAYPLRRQLMFVVTLGIFGIALCSFLVSSWQSTQRMRSDLLDQGQRITENLANQSQLALLTSSPENVNEAVNATLAFPGVIGVVIRHNDGRVLLSKGDNEALRHFALLAATAPVDAVQLVEDTDRFWRFVAPVKSTPSEDSPFSVQPAKAERLGQVSVAMSKAALTQMTRDLLIANLISLFFFTVLFLALVRYLTLRATQPLDRLSDAMARAEAGEKQVRAQPSGPQDVAAMAVAFNKMMEVLEEREGELLTARDRALEYGRMKAEFAATVSHEVRTPMNGVIGMLDILKAMKLPRQQREFVNVAWSSARSLLELINDILDFSKLDAGKMVLEPRPFNLRQSLEELIDLFAVQAHQKGLEIGYLIAPDVPERLLADGKRIRQVIANLLANAVKFTERGEVAVRVSCTHGEPLRLRVEVSDTGIGIDAAARTHLFESFAQADPSTTRKYGGSGLGLAISRQLVSLMGGEIDVDSQPGQGSRFWFNLPCHLAASPERHPAPISTTPAAAVMVVEHSEIVSAFLCQVLSEQGLTSECLDSSQQALTKLHAAAADGHPYGLIIMDATYALAANGELAQQVRSDQQLAATRILVMDRLGSEAGDDVAAFWQVDGYLAKPLHLDKLRAALQTQLHASQAHASQAQASRAQAGQARPAEVAANSHANLAAGPCRVLVVEDNRTNQLVATGMLNMLGCQSVVVAGGADALETLRRDSFDLVLMDCNMPEMDGYQATAHIRVMEGETGQRTPIVAMTANTRQADVDKCLAAGMDEHLGKPLTLEALSNVIHRWTGRDLIVQTSAFEANQLASGESVDRGMLAKLREALGETLGQAIEPFLEDVPDQLKQLGLAMASGDFETAHRLAHNIKGSAGNLGALRLAALARQTEDQAHAQQRPSDDAWLDTLREEFAQAGKILAKELRHQPASEPHPTQQAPLVLVVDDDRSTRAALRFVLQRDGLRVEEASDGAEALEMMAKITPDVVLMDALMPVMDGFTACAKLQEIPGKAVPVLMITALEEADAISRAFAAGACDYIAKPVHLGVVSQRVRRIIESRRAEQHVRQLAYNDTLTGLANRAMFVDLLSQRLTRAREHSQWLAVLFLDLDRFKLVNDTLGHDIGDRLLVSVAKRIQHCVRAGDTVARFGGDEFAVLLEDIINPVSAASTAASKICRALAAPFEIDGHDIFVSASIGIAAFPDDGDDVNTLLRHADAAMYRAKRDNTGYAHYQAEMESTISERMRLDNALRRALERDELIVYYQPKVHLSDDRIHGMEALLRWRHPERGMVPPNEFIPIAEDTGLIIPIGEWVLRHACQQAKEWNRDAHTPLTVAVNLSGLQLKQEGFTDMVARVLAETGLKPDLLELEITESMLMEQVNETLAVLKRLKEIGVHLSIDDFGTGYSSLAYLKRFPVDTLKIDRSFVRDVTTDPDAAAIVNGIIALAHSLRLDVIAEGVETEQQRNFLEAAGCDVIQGFLIAQPMAASEFASRLLELPN